MQNPYYEAQAIMADKYSHYGARQVRHDLSDVRIERRQSLISKLIQSLNPMSIVQDLYRVARIKRDQAIAINSSRVKITSH